MAGRKHQAGERERSKRTWRLEDIQKLIDSLVAREISEFEMEQDGLRISVRRGQAPVVSPASLTNQGAVPVPGPRVMAQYAPTPSAPAPAAAVVKRGGTAPTEVSPAEALHIIN